MTLCSLSLRLLILAPLALVLSGCFPIDTSSADEQKDPHFLAGKSRINSMDFDGAITAFESALISNPKSASAHLELALLYEEKKSNYAAAIYHFERHLKLNPKSKWKEIAEQHIYSCKLELAKTVSFALVSRQVQDELHKLHATEKVLREKVEFLQGELVKQAEHFSNQLAIASQISLPIPDVQPQSRTETARQQTVSERRPDPAERRPPVAVRRNPPAETRTSPVQRQPTTSQFRSQPYPMAMPRSHIVKPGETLSGISKKYNIKLSALQAANPYVEARKLRAGQVLNIPTTR